MHTNIKEINREKTHLLPPETEFAGVRVRGSRGVPWFLGLEGVAGEDAGLTVETAVCSLWLWERPVGRGRLTPWIQRSVLMKVQKLCG